MPSNVDIVLTPAARREQEKRGSAKAYARKVEAGYPDRVTSDLAGFIAELDTAFLGTASAEGAPLHPASRRTEGLHQGAR